jgi:murein DD-endopeptidase MepM/ murein hydrolase activator NlpD
VAPKPKPAVAGRKIVADSGKFVFPVAAPWSFRDTWGAPRSRGRTHKGVDIFASIGQDVYAFTSGRIVAIQDSDDYGKGLFLSGKDGYLYGFVHIDRVANGIRKGKQVKVGDLIAYSGRTGIDNSPAHTHFQAKAKNKQYENPFPWLINILGMSGHYRPGQKISSIVL